MVCSLIGAKLLGNVFVQDIHPNWLRIDNIALGESSKFGYYTVENEPDVNTLLDKLQLDFNVTCLVYNSTDAIGYVKTGFDLNDRYDIKKIKNIKTYILKDKIKYYFPTYSPPISDTTNNTDTTEPDTEPDNTDTTEPDTDTTEPDTDTDTTEPPSGDFVSYDGTMKSFMLSNNRFIPVGFNAYWLGYTEFYNYPTNQQVDEMFDLAVRMKATVIRSHTLGFSSGSSGSLRPFDNTLNEAAWASIDYAFYKAKMTNIKLICPLTDAYNYYHGSYGDFCATLNLNKNDFWTNIGVRNDFKTYISDYLNHVNSYTGLKIKDSPELFIIELGNELGNYRPQATSESIPTYEWINDISNYIKSIDNNHLVMSGSDECLGGEISNDFEVGSIDVFSSHFYSEDYYRIDRDSNKADEVGKSYIIGEVSSGFGEGFVNNILSRENVKGMLFWSVYPHESGIGSSLIPHDDGFTLYYPENKEQLLMWSNYFRRAQNYDTVSDL